MRRSFVTLLLVFVFPGSAAAGTFDVHTVGCPSGWKAQTFAPGKLQQEDGCSSWRIWSSAPLEQGDFAAMSMYAGDGAQFTGFSVRSAGHARSGTDWTMAVCKPAFANCTNHSSRSGDMPPLEMALGAVYPGAAPLYGTHIYAAVRCLQTTCADSNAADVTHTSAHVIVDDFTAPGTPTLSGVSSGWNSGSRDVGYTVSDAGSGIAAAELVVDGEAAPQTSIEHACLRLPGGDYSHPIPCATATGGQFALDTRELTDGRHSLTVTVADAGGNPGSATQEFLVDNTPPDPPEAATVDGGDGWRRSNDFAIYWQNPGSSGGSPIAGAYYKVGDAPTGGADGTFVAGADATSLTSVHAPGDGDWPLYVWLQDEAGNAEPPAEPVARLRLDTAAPSLAFVGERSHDNPAELRVETADAMSGVAGGRVEIRRKGDTDWRALDTRLEGSALLASVPDDRLARGTYEFQATAWDAAGNSAATTARADGQSMVLALPLRAATRLSATLARHAGPASRSIRIGYGNSAWLRGSLRSAAGALPRTRLLVTARSLAGGRRRWRTAVVTDGRGRYAVRLPKGGSRDITVRFPGNARLRPAERHARLLVRGWASLELRPPSLRRGGTIAFVGRVGSRGAKLPPAGKLVQIQFLDGRRWRPAVKLGHTRPGGRFTIRYRFRRISRPTRIYFRILVPAEGGWPYATGWSPVRVAFVRP